MPRPLLNLCVAPLFPDEPERLKLRRPGIRRAEWMAPIAEAQGAVHYCGQVVFDRARLDRHKKLAAAIFGDVLHLTRRPRILVAPQETRFTFTHKLVTPTAAGVDFLKQRDSTSDQ